MTVSYSPTVDSDAEAIAALDAKVATLNARFHRHGATAVLEAVLRDRLTGDTALVSSYGAESVVLLHLAALIDPGVPVLFLDTGQHFAETLVYVQDLSERLKLWNVRQVEPDAARLAHVDPDGTLHARDPDACCALRKTAPLEAALGPFDAWITGRKRYQGGMRAKLAFFERDGLRIKVNPLARWSPGDLRTYREENRLPLHPLVREGFASIGCAPCTRAVQPGEDPRAGRWAGQKKTECGIHLDASGRLRRNEQ
ncbi:phosphoadenylyl-sulfate reductase [Cognatishimia sp. F0-27]|uniref:phosphoadenylyl-sulfate reductase n=1 Tax=Cognatishimia sp. F0-27 TaxID=2816855 RepID=UPI001D0CDC30|nr:phosphoadenylyl-sulfate reductase [Cognatishimia sp. F0-27]MCC1492348.1 phosphoadenylyl-sulfate reductase [Cognatishimia sp. F0-27]